MESVEVRRSPRARRWRLEVPWDEPARLTVPQSMSRAEVDRVLAEKQQWIAEQRRRQIPLAYRLLTGDDPLAQSLASARADNGG